MNNPDISVCIDTLNEVYAAYILKNPNWWRPTNEIVHELYPQMQQSERDKIVDCIDTVREAIKGCNHFQYDPRPSKIAEVKTEGYQWLKEQFPWLNDKNIEATIAVALYKNSR